MEHRADRGRAACDQFGTFHLETRELQFGEDAYVSGAGLPSFRIPQLTGACLEEFSVDGLR
ncbi:hypothetical protein [Paraburkholderia sp. JHI869]|uniref:hypothetical protein n=1 Tax=Paraburkholderia sp. JHI869 TaxID=3112959 RepID=UPI0031804AFD